MPVAVYVLGMAIFSMGTTEMMLSGLLPSLTAHLSISLPTAGLLISGFAIGVAIGGPLLTSLLVRLEPKLVLLMLLGLFVLGQSLGAVAPTYSVLMVSRVIAAAAMGAFFGRAASVVVGLAGSQRRGRALAVLVGGLTVSSVIGLPIATLVGQHFGWRASFWMVSVLAVLSFVGVLAWVPRQERGPQVSLRSGLSIFRSGRLWATLAANALALAAFLGTFSYITPLLTDVTGFSLSTVPILQVLYGVGCIAGIAVGGRFADRRPDLSLFVALACSVAVLAFFALVVHHQIATVVAFLAFGFVAFGSNPAMTSRAMAQAADSPLAASANASAFNVGVAAGPWLGGLAIGAGYGLVAPIWIGVALAAASLVLNVVSLAVTRRTSRVPAKPAAPDPERVVVTTGRIEE
ncbi:MFS transporter [Kribbella sp. NPDC058245]|uniref:MFS transporter n=1 Tax=Kribbella sp. NPDC058245 TaxID=3346399 RepID=UPI0036EF51C0